MVISNLKIRNFKSIASADIDFNPLTMLVGANASGKSNLINVFRFISNIANDGIDNAVALQGGMPYLANASLPKGTPIEIAFTLDLSNEGWIRSTDEKAFGMEIKAIDYRFILQPNLKGGGYHITTDSLMLTFDWVNVDLTTKGEKHYAPAGIQYSLLAEKKSAKASIQLSHSFFPPEKADVKMREVVESDITPKVFARICNEDKKELMLYRISMLLPAHFSESTFIRIFDFDPKELKKSSSMASMKILEENGSNIASVLNNILRTKGNRKKLTTLLNEFLPFVNGVSVENNFDKSFSYKIQEKFSNRAFHANFLSDGTVSLLAIIIALYFEEMSDVIILEEPERNIHPKLLSNLLASAEDVSSEKQVIITTHNPEFLKHVDIKNVRFVQRDTNGYTLLSTPSDNKAVSCFMQNDLGLDDLFLQDMLGE